MRRRHRETANLFQELIVDNFAGGGGASEGIARFLVVLGCGLVTIVGSDQRVNADRTLNTRTLKEVRMSDANHTTTAPLFEKPTGSTGRVTMRHGLSRVPEYRVWQTMRLRCHDPKHAAYPSYGGRGITVCERWLNSPENFIADMGSKPTPDHEIDRIDNNKGYSPENCQWATRKENSRNRRSNRMLECQGETKTLAEWCEQFDIPRDTLSKRLDADWPVVAALTTPARTKAANSTRVYQPRTQLWAWEAAIEVLKETGSKSVSHSDSELISKIAVKLGWDGPRLSRRVMKSLGKRTGKLVKTMVPRVGKGTQIAAVYSLPSEGAN